jgi:ketosteroid isomerase-like protein
MPAVEIESPARPADSRVTQAGPLAIDVVRPNLRASVAGELRPPRARSNSHAKESSIMAARTPEDLDRLFAIALNSGDIDGLMRLYEPQAALRPAPGQLVQGHAAIRTALGGFIAMKPTLTIAPKVLGQNNDIALITASWTLAGTGADGRPVQMAGQSVEVARRQRDGTWLFAIDTPWGLEATA